MSLDQAIDYALGGSLPEIVIDAGPLSRREREVATLVASGGTNRQIGERLFMTERTVEGHIERIMNKLGVRSRTEVAMWVVERGLVSPPTTTEPDPSKRRGTRNRAPSIQRL
jgi:DNA-binding NarL/FixJ family response regulator